jgi:hypothetical protein
MRTKFDKFSDLYVKYYSPTECLSAVEIIVIFKARVVIKQYMPKKYRWFGIKVYRLSDYWMYVQCDCS